MDEAQLRLHIAEAEVAYHKLMTGQAVVEVRDSSSETIRFSQANASRLRQYISELKYQLQNLLSARPATRGPIRPVFM